MRSAEESTMKFLTLRRRQTGFTLIEMMCGVTVAGILSSIAYPSYQNVVQRTRRADGQVALLQVQMAQERYRADHAGYGSLSEIGVPPASAAGYYTITMGASSSSGFEVVASAAGPQTSDSGCRVLKLTVDGANVAYASGADSNVANTGTVNKKCWGQ